jgi:predicted XRE-type DNA-binding protein
MSKRKDEQIPVVIGSDNIFKDLGFPEPEEALAKAELIRQISLIIKKRRLTQEQVSKLLKLPQPKVSLLLRGRITGFSTDRLLRFLNDLNCDVEIRIRIPRSRRRRQGRIAVTMG